MSGNGLLGIGFVTPESSTFSVKTNKWLVFWLHHLMTSDFLLLRKNHRFLYILLHKTDVHVNKSYFITSFYRFHSIKTTHEKIDFLKVSVDEYSLFLAPCFQYLWNGDITGSDMPLLIKRELQKQHFSCLLLYVYKTGCISVF